MIVRNCGIGSYRPAPAQPAAPDSPKQPNQPQKQDIIAERRRVKAMKVKIFVC